MRKVAIALLPRCCKHSHASTFETDLAPFIPSRSLANLSDGEVCAVSEIAMGGLEMSKGKEKRARSKSFCSKQDLGGLDGPFHTEFVADVAAKASCKVKSDAYAQGWGLVATRRTKTQLTCTDAIPVEDSAKAGRRDLAAGKTEELASSTQETLERTSAQEHLTEVMERLDINTYRRGKQWEEASHKLLHYGIPPTYIAGMLGKCRNVACSVHCVDSTLNTLSLLGMSHVQIGRVISKWPRIINISDTMFRSKIEFFESIGIDRHIFSKGNIRVFIYSLPILRRNASFLKDYMAEVHTDAVPFMMSKDPEVLACNIPSKLAWFKSQKFDKKALLKRPRILACSLHLLSLKAEMLQCFGISDARKRARALCIVYGLRMSKLQARYNNLHAAGFSCDQLRTILSNCPSVLGFTEERINSKLNYAVQVMNTPLKEIAYNAAFWGISLEKRLKPRYEVLKELQTLGAREHGVSLGYMIGMSDLDFHQKFVERYQYIGKHGKDFNV